MRYEFVPLVLTQELFEMVEEDETLLVGHGGKSVIRIFAFQIYHQFRELSILSVSLHGVLQRFPSDYG